MRRDKQKITHRCKGSLRAGVSIRFGRKYKGFTYAGDYENWRLFMYLRDYDYDRIYEEYVTEITYCPFCGIKLKGLEED